MCGETQYYLIPTTVSGRPINRDQTAPARPLFQCDLKEAKAQTPDPSYGNLAAFRPSWTSWKCSRKQKSDVVFDKARASGFLHHLDGLLLLGRVIAVFLSVVQKFAEGLSDRFSSLEHPCVFIHGWYGSFHKTFTP